MPFASCGSIAPLQVGPPNNRGEAIYMTGGSMTTGYTYTIAIAPQGSWGSNNRGEATYIT